MQEFRTILSQAPSDLKFNHLDPVLSIGSCFAEHIGARLNRLKFPTLINPFGILYNPHSIANTLAFLIQEKKFEEKDVFESNGLWHSFNHHGHFSKPSISETLEGINSFSNQGNEFLKTSKRLLITFGTSNVFIYKKTNQIVANCHKLPNQEFDRNALDIETIINKLSPVFEQLKTINPNLEILLTVSPVRHIRDGLIENQRSKSRLLIACEHFCKTFNFVHYFPSYEIMMDDLRDYRFYDQDMIHPNQTAIDYIWDFFAHSFFTDTTKDLNSRIGKIIAASKHKAFHQASEGHQDFLKNTLTIIDKIKIEHNFLDFKEEQTILKQQLTST